MDVRFLDGAAGPDIRRELLAFAEHEARRLPDAADEDLRYAAFELHTEGLETLDRQRDLRVSL